MGPMCVPGGGDDTASQISAMDSSAFTETVTENVQSADPTLADIVVDEIEVEEVVVYEPPTNAPTASPTARPTPAPHSPEPLPAAREDR